MKNLLPLITPEKLFTKKSDTMPKIMYLRGMPRQYRLDCSKANLNFNGKANVTESGKEFQVIPLAIRTIEADLFGQGEKKWCEFYFLNQALQVSCFMFHKHSLDNFRNEFAELYYDQVDPCSCIWTIGFDAKQTVDGNGQKAKYHIATFHYEVLKPKQLEAMQILRNEIKQEDTFIYQERTKEHLHTYRIHSSSPLEPTDEDLKLMAKQEAKRQKGLDEMLGGSIEELKAKQKESVA